MFQTTDEELEHMRRETACSFKEATIDGLTSGQVNVLKSRTFGRGKPEKEKWRLIYGYLFPGDPVPSPCTSFAIRVFFSSLRSHGTA